MLNQFTTETKINFKQVREFGDIFNVTFEFIRENFKGLIIPLLIYVGPLVAIFGVLYGIFITKFMGPNNLRGGLMQYNTSNSETDATLYIIAIGILALLVFSLLTGVINSYIIFYIKKGKNNFTRADIFNNALKYFFPLLLTNLLTLIFVWVGSLLCLLPGIYLAISMSFISFIVMYEKKGVGNALSRTFQISHSKWWWNFLITILFVIIILIIVSILATPFIIVHSLYQFGQINPEIADLIYISALSITYSLSFLTNTIFYIAIAFQYFSIVEEKEAPDLYNRIGQIGQDTNHYTN